jgi:hypothetical protein
MPQIMAQKLGAAGRIVLGIPIGIALRTTPCTWRAGTKLLEDTGGIQTEVSLDAWKVRDEFLNLRTEEGFLSFLNRTGRFTARFGKGTWSYTDFLQWQRTFREFLNVRPPRWGAWLSSLPNHRDLFMNAVRQHVDFRIQFHWRSRQHAAIILAEDSLTAILASIYVDHMRGARYSFCSRPDCRKPYEVVTKHKRKYCNQYCAHLESVRRMRKREAAKAAT